MLSTNGWFVTPRVATRLKKAGFTHVRVSIDGASAKTHDYIRGVKGSFAKAINAVKILKNAEIPRVGISPTIFSDNVHEVAEIIELGARLGVDEMQLVQLCRTGRGIQVQTMDTDQLLKVRQVFEYYRKKLIGKLSLTATEGLENDYFELAVSNALPDFWGCAAGRTCLAIKAEGTVQPCILYGVSAGNIRKTSLKDIWLNSSLFKKIRTVRESCQDCDFSEVCSGECPIECCLDNLYRQKFICLNSKKGEGENAKVKTAALKKRTSSC